jgi:uncharacterized beta-barrel protein YwiB (DUF1934 family)
MSEAASKLPVSVKLVTEVRDGSQTDTTTLQANGQLFEKNGNQFLSYEEKLEDIGSVRTLVKLSEEQVLIMRSGDVSMRQSFEKGEVTHGHYEHAYGRMQLITQTENINIQVKESPVRGKLLLTYVLTVQGERAGRYKLTLTYRELENVEGDNS